MNYCHPKTPSGPHLKVFLFAFFFWFIFPSSALVGIYQGLQLYFPPFYWLRLLFPGWYEGDRSGKDLSPLFQLQKISTTALSLQILFSFLRFLKLFHWGEIDLGRASAVAAFPLPSQHHQESFLRVFLDFLTEQLVEFLGGGAWKWMGILCMSVALGCLTFSWEPILGGLAFY